MDAGWFNSTTAHFSYDPVKETTISNVLAEIKERLKAGRTVFVKYNNPDNDDLHPIWEFNALKLVPKSNGRYDRYWRSEENDAWVQHLGDLDQDPNTMNPVVHAELLFDEQAAIDFVSQRLKGAEASNGHDEKKVAP